MMNPRILRVALPNHLRKFFEYLLPENCLDLKTLAPGLRVRVPFGFQEKVGIIHEITDSPEYPLSKLKAAYEIIDNTTLFPPSILELISWASHYYHCSLGSVFESAMPTWFRKGKHLSVKDLTDPKNKKQMATETVNSPILNPEQEKAIQTIILSLGKFQTFLLNGITGSGKTEVYMKTIEATLKLGRQALVLVPEIGLTPQMIARFEARFNVSIAILHSGISEKKRAKSWELARTGKAGIVLGTRSAAFVPLLNPGIFIIDEEHDLSFKQQEGFRYSARDLLIMRAQIEQCPIVLGTATPALETFFNVESGRYKCLTLSLRTGISKKPTLTILDVRHKKLDEGLSLQLISKISEHLEQQGQVLLFLNRRGYAPVLLCFDCGWIASCKHCDSNMTIYYQEKKMKCHHCESVLPLFQQCFHCKSHHINPIGIGTERLEAVLSRHFPNKNIVRIDKDTTRRKDAFKKVMEDIENGKAHILLGTQMIAKGHHFPNLTLVGILNIDQSFFSSEFRSIERVGQLITQVSGRAGREKRLGEVLLQTAYPEHPLLNTLLNQGYSEFAKILLRERFSTGLPPYCFQALFRAESKSKDNASQFLLFIKKFISKITENKSLEIFGPVPAPLEKRNGKFRTQLLLQSKKRRNLHTIIDLILPELDKHPLAKKTRWSLDIDPLDMF